MICRPATDADRVFIISSWLDSFRDANMAGMIAVEDWYPVMWPQVEKLLGRPGTRTVVASDDDSSVLYGFIHAEVDVKPAIVHYVYVKELYRRWKHKPGIARRLFAEVDIDPRSQFDYTYKTATVSHMASKIPLAKWQPNLAKFPKGQGIRR